MSSIDRRVVEAKFDNKQFKSGVKETMDDLSDLKKGLKMDGATRGLNEVDSAAKKLSLAGVGESVNNLADKFNTLRVVGVAAFTALVLKAGQAALQIARTLTIDPVTDGLAEYETNLNSIQTILSNTAWEDKTLDDVNDALAELNEYSDLTIYNFAEMARNIGTFTAAGVDLDTSVGAIKGIANLAAISGSNSQQASTAMYQLSQALSTGTVKLMDWNSVVNAGMGGKVFQDAVKETARAHGIAVDEIIEDAGSFRDSLASGWFTSEILTDTLSTFTGDLSRAQLEQMGYAEDQIDGILEMGETAVNAATKIKTVTQLMDTLQETAGSGWSRTWQLIFGDFEEAKDLFTGLNDTIGGWIDASSDARNAVLEDWKEMGGRTALIEGIGEAFDSLLGILKPISQAFRDVFPPITGEILYDLTVGFKEFFENFKIGETLANNLRRTFRGLFAVFGIGWEVLKATAIFLGDVFSKVSEGGSGIFELTGNMGDFLVALYETIKNGEDLTEFFENLSSKLDKPIAMIRNFVDAIKSFFGELEVGAPNLDGVTNTLDRIPSIGDLVLQVWGNIASIMRNVWDAFVPVATGIANFFSDIAIWVQDAVSGLDVDYSDFLSTINTGLFAGLVLLFRNFLDNMGGGLLEDLVEGITDPFEALTGTMETMQNTLRATTLLQIAAAIGIMTWSAVGLSKIDPEGLNRALGALTAMFVQLFSAMYAFQLIGGAKGLASSATGLVIMAVAIRILTSSVKSLAELSWEDLTKGLTGVTALLVAVSGAVKLMSGNAGGMITAGLGLLIISGAIKVLASAVGDFAEMEWGELTRGLTAVATLLVALSLFSKFTDAGGAGISSGVGLLLLAASIKALASATKDFAELSWGDISKGLVSITGILTAFMAFTRTMKPGGLIQAGLSLAIVGGAMIILAEAFERFGALSWESIGKGMTAMAGALVAIVSALNLVPATAVISAGSIAVVAASLLLIAEALRQTGDMSWEEIARGLVALGGSLLIISLGLMAMSGALPGAAALVVAAGALNLLVPVLVALGDMSWGEIGKGLATLAGVFVLLGLAGLLLTPVIPSLLGLGLAITLIGVGVAAAGAGVLAFSVGLTALAASATIVSLAIVAMGSAIIGLIPALIRNIAIGLVLFAEVIAQAGPAMLDAMSVVLNSIINAIALNAPDIINLFVELALAMLDAIERLQPRVLEVILGTLLGILQVIEENIPEIVDTTISIVVKMVEALRRRVPELVRVATDLIVAFIRGISNNINRVVDAGADLIIRLIRGIANAALRIADEGAQAVINFLNGLATSIRRNTRELRAAGVNIAGAIIDGLTGGLASKVGEVVSAARDVARNALDSAKSFLGISSPSKEFEKLGQWSGEGLANGVANTSSMVGRAAGTVANNALDTVRSTMSEMSDLIDLNLNTDPTIRPIIDMSEIKKGAEEISSTIGSGVKINAAISQAKDVSSLTLANQLASQDRDGLAVDNRTEVTYIQNNNSPKALSASEIYRQTQNQLSTTKEVVRNATAEA